MGVLVTGGAGYIGSVAADLLLAAGEKVVVLDNLSTGHRDAVAPGAEFVEGNILNGSLIADLIRRHDVDTVMHFAALSLVGESCQKPLKYFGNNVGGAHNVLDAMVRAGAKRFILSSTAAVYGHVESVPITEDAPANPLNPYGLSKRIIEQMLEWHDRAYGIRYVALRYFNAAGATPRCGEDHRPETHLIPNVLSAAEGSQDELTVFGDDYPTPDGTCVRDYIHVAYLADAHLKAMEYLREGGESDVMNLGNNVGNSVYEVIEAVRRVTGHKVPFRVAGRRPGDAPNLVASAKKARERLGWSPVRGNIDNIVADAWAWRQAHPGGYAS